VSELGDLEAAVMGLISAIQSGGAPAFRSVVGFADADRRRTVARISGLAAPAAVVIYTGRVRTSMPGSVIGLPKVTVLLRAQNLRGRAAVRSGDTTALGAFDVLSLATATLDGAIVQTDRRLVALDEQTLTADETHVVYEQRYLVDRVAEATQPTFDGVVLAGANSAVNVVVGDATAETVSFAFPGIDGVFRHHLGMRDRAIGWTGQLRDVDDAALNTTEAAIEAAVANPGAFDMVDAWSRTFSDCTLDRFVRRGPRSRHPVTGEALQSFELQFTQLNP